MKPHFIYITIILILLGSGYSYYQHVQHQYASYKSMLREKQDTITYHLSKEGKLIAETKAAEVKMKDFKKYYPNEITELHALGIKPKDVKSFSKQVFKAEGKGEMKYATLDGELYVVGDSNVYYTAQAYDKRYFPINTSAFKLIAQDGYLNFQADVYDELHTPYEYQYADTLTQVFHFKRRWIFGRQTLYSSAMLANKNAKITNSQNVMVKEYRDKRFGIGPYIGLGWSNSIKPQTNFGISIHWSLIKF